MASKNSKNKGAKPSKGGTSKQSTPRLSGKQLQQRDEDVLNLSADKVMKKYGMNSKQVSSRKSQLVRAGYTATAPRIRASKKSTSTDAVLTNNTTTSVSTQPEEIKSQGLQLDINGQLFLIKQSTSKVEIDDNSDITFGDSEHDNTFEFINRGQKIFLNNVPTKITIDGTLTTFD